MYCDTFMHGCNHLGHDACILRIHYWWPLPDICAKLILSLVFLFLTCVIRISIKFLYLILVVLLRWFVDEEVVNAALSGIIIEEEQVEVKPEKVPASCLDENVCLESCRKYFTQDAWNNLQAVVKVIRKRPVWYCGRCTHRIKDETQSSVICESCLTWFHFLCLGLKQPPKAKMWFCRSCYGECWLS